MPRLRFALIVHEALNAIVDDDAAVAACVYWADTSDMLDALHEAVLERMSEPGTEFGLHRVAGFKSGRRPIFSAICSFSLALHGSVERHGRRVSCLPPRPFRFG